MNRVAIVLAAGSARRFGGDKLSAEFQGEPLVFHAIRAARAAPVSRVLIVCKSSLETGEWNGAPPVERIEIESETLSASLKAGIAAAHDADAAFIFLGDMPLVPHHIADRLANRLKDNFAALPCHDGQPGHPAFLSSRAFPHISTLTGDEGAGKILKQRADVIFDECSNSSIHLDVDRPEDIEKLEGIGRAGITGQGH